MQAPKPYLQTPEKSQSPNPKERRRAVGFGAWNLKLPWNLELGVWNLPHPSLRAPHSAFRPRRAFTLIELLVVISIIGILVAIALPTLSTFRPNPAAVATRQLLDATARVRQLAISQRTTVYMIFVPSNFWKDPNYTVSVGSSPAELEKAKRLYDKQLIGYTFVSLRGVGDQPGAFHPRYLSEWKTLPQGAFIPLQKFSPSPPSNRNANNANLNITNYDAGGNPFLAFSIYGFLTTNTIPFPSEVTPPVVVGGTQHWVTVPYIAFNYLGQLVDAQNQLIRANEVIPLSKGNVLFMRDPATKVATNLSPLLAEQPPGNTTNTFNLVNIEWLTGRARAEHREVR